MREMRLSSLTMRVVADVREIPKVKLIDKKTSTLHDFPYNTPDRKCLHCWVINVTPAGYDHCIHKCVYCYGRSAIYGVDGHGFMHVYKNLPELVERDLKKIRLCPPISISNITDPCQNVLQVRREVKRLVELIMDYGVSFVIITKADPSFLLDLDGFIEYPNKFIAVTIEGTEDIIKRLSPGAPSFKERLSTVKKLSNLGIKTSIRLDPVFIHLFQALYGSNWFEKVEELIGQFADAGCLHVVSSTGRLSTKPIIYRESGRRFPSMRDRLYEIIKAVSPSSAQKFLRDYKFERSTSTGYFLRRDIRLDFHRRVRGVCESHGMTYATCMDTHAWETDSKGIPHCEGLPIPFAIKGSDGRFKPIEGCTANCHVTCKGKISPPCDQPKLAVPAPYKISYLK